MSAERNYPIPPPAEDDRFNFGLMYDLAKVIEAHGYPKMTGHDIVSLQQAIFRVIYDVEDPTPGV